MSKVLIFSPFVNYMAKLSYKQIQIIDFSKNIMQFSNIPLGGKLHVLHTMINSLNALLGLW